MAHRRGDNDDDDVVVTLADIERLGTARMSTSARGYYQSGADQQQTLQENTSAYRRLRLLPRMLRDVSHREMGVTLLGGRERLSLPIGIAPTAMQKMAHPEGEAATARAARDAGTLMIVSTIATTSLEDVREAAPDGRRWFQLYVYRDRDVTRALVQRAEQAGYSALVLTVDTPYFGQRLADVRNKLALPPGLKMANFQDADFQNVAPAAGGGSGLSTYASALFDPSLTWKDVDWLKSITHLPVIIKGILRALAPLLVYALTVGWLQSEQIRPVATMVGVSYMAQSLANISNRMRVNASFILFTKGFFGDRADDAAEAVDHGAAAILVSNHGARQIDGEPSTIECLPKVVRAVAGRCEVYLDGGVRCGTDVAKALCLGAKAVFIGRPVLWGLAYKGKEGVDHVLAILRLELDRAMGLLGCRTISDLTPDLVVREEHFSKL